MTARSPGSAGGADRSSSDFSFTVLSDQDVKARAKLRGGGLSQALNSSSSTLSEASSLSPPPTTQSRPSDELRTRSKHQSLDLERPFVMTEEEQSAGSRRVQGKRQNVYGHVREDEESDFPRDDGDGFVPPHLISLPNFRSPLEDRMRPGSLFEGVGRKLRGMDAVRFRRAVMTQTGFLENLP